MLLRTLVTIVNLGIFVAAIAVQFLLPALASPYLFYLLFAYFVASIFILRHPVMNQRVFERPPRWSASGPTAPAPPGQPRPGELGFCAHCGTMVAPGTVTCPACGRTVPVY